MKFGRTIDDERIGRLLSVSEDRIRESRLAYPLERLCQVSLMSDRLRICRSCMEHGYHSIYFQIEALSECPIHNCRLTDQCPSCAADLPFFGVCSELFGTPFCCPHCGASYGPSTVKSLFPDDETVAAYAKGWSALEQWIKSVLSHNYAYGSIRSWTATSLQHEKDGVQYSLCMRSEPWCVCRSRTSGSLHQ